MDVYARNNVKVVGNPDGPTVMLAHGFGCDQNLWRLVTERLAPDFRIVLFDHVGAGASDPSAWDAERYGSLAGYASDVLDLVRELDLHDVVFVGHSVAAMIGVLAVAADPSRFGKLDPADAVTALPRRRRRLSRRILPRRRRRTPRIPRGELPGLVAGDGSQHHGHPRPARAG